MPLSGLQLRCYLFLTAWFTKWRSYALWRGHIQFAISLVLVRHARDSHWFHGPYLEQCLATSAVINTGWISWTEKWLDEWIYQWIDGFWVWVIPQRKLLFVGRMKSRELSLGSRETYQSHTLFVLIFIQIFSKCLVVLSKVICNIFNLFLLGR